MVILGVGLAIIAIFFVAYGLLAVFLLVSLLVGGIVKLFTGGK